MSYPEMSRRKLDGEKTVRTERRGQLMLYSSPLARRSPGQLPFFVILPYGRSEKVPETNPPPATIGVTIARREAHSSPDRPVLVSSTCVERSLKGYHHQVSRPESNLTGWLQLATRMRLVWSGLA